MFITAVCFLFLIMQDGPRLKYLGTVVYLWLNAKRIINFELTHGVVGAANLKNRQLCSSSVLNGAGTGIRNPDIVNDDRNNPLQQCQARYQPLFGKGARASLPNLQQCVINKYLENYFVLFIFFAELQPQTVV